MDQKRIVFTRFQSDGKEMFNDLYAIDPDGTNETRLTMNPGPTGEYSDNAAPRYNKDRTMIAFISTRNNAKKLYNIFFMDLATRKTAQITNGDLNISSVDWSPDDGKLVFSCCDDKGVQQVNVVNMDGTGFTKLTEGPAEHMNPMWSPSGDRIAFVEFPPQSKSSFVWVMDPQGGNRKRLTPDEAAHSNPSWSPDGAWIIYRCDIGIPHLRRINVDTGEFFILEPPARGADSAPIWSGSEIVFSSSRDWEDAEAIFNLYTMSIDGEGLQRLTTGQTFDYCGDW